ncbi:MAG TPA: response regulator transcription factor [Acidimicrobiales bacterium]|nr:response regulator transcription factor [Acidimicrobiales bacterium]
MEAVRVLLVEDHPIISESLAMALRLEGLEARVAQTFSVDAVLGLAASYKPDMVVLDLQLGDLLSLPMIRPLSAAGATVVMLTGVKDEALLGQCLEAGAVGVIPKESEFDLLRQAVRDAADGRPVMAEQDRIRLLDTAAQARRDEKDRLAPFRALTKREAVVLSHLTRAQSAEDIAASEFVSLATVRSQIQAVLRKLGVNSQLAAVALAKDRGWAQEE